jgi:hypothetical protein
MQQLNLMIDKWFEEHELGPLDSDVEDDLAEAGKIFSTFTFGNPACTEGEAQTNDDWDPTDVGNVKRMKSLAQLDRRQMPDNETVRIVKVEAHFEEILILDSRDTLIATLFGYELGDTAYAMHKKLGLYGYAMWFLAYGVGLLCLFDVLPSTAGVFSLFGVFPLFVFWTTANTHLLMRLMKTFEAWYLTALSGMALVVAADVFQYDGRVAFITLAFLSVATSVWFDAAHTTFKKFIPYIMAFGILFLMMLIPCLYFGIVPNLNTRDINLNVSDGTNLSINNVVFVTEKLATIMLFFAKNLFTAVRHPNCYTNLKSRLTTEKIKVRELRQRLRRRRARVSELATINSLNHKKGRGRGRGRGTSECTF